MFSWLKGKKAKIRQTSRRRRTALGVEGLEGRALLAGVVDVFVSGGTLFLTGDALVIGRCIAAVGPSAIALGKEEQLLLARIRFLVDPAYDVGNEDVRRLRKAVFDRAAIRSG